MSTTETKNFYYVENMKVEEDAAKKYWKTLYKEYNDFYNVIIGGNAHAEVQAFADKMATEWKSIPFVNVTEAFAEKNIEVRRLYFKAIGVTELFEELKPILIDTKTLEKDGVSWLPNGTEISAKMKDDYELYKIDGNKLFPEETSSWRADNATIYAVRCWCSTTGREYWIYVPRNIGDRKDALEAIAWTVQLNITNPEYIYRQGDVILAKHSATSQECRPYHLEAEQYVKLLKAES